MEAATYFLISEFWIPVCRAAMFGAWQLCALFLFFPKGPCSSFYFQYLSIFLSQGLDSNIGVQFDGFHRGVDREPRGKEPGTTSAETKHEE